MTFATMTLSWRRTAGAMLAAGLLALGSGAAEAAWPERAIDIVVAYAPGGGTDLFARMVAQHMNEEWGVPVNVVNIPGGNQLPGIDAVTKAAPDGYTLLLETSATSAIKAIDPNSTLDLEARTYGPLLAAQGGLVMVNGGSPWQTVGDMIAFIKENPDRFTYVRLGGTSYSDLLTKALFSVADIDPNSIKPIDYTGNGPGNIAVAGGHVMMSAGSINPMIKSGDLKVLAIAGNQRAKDLPEVPTLTEAGYPVEFVSYFGISGPAGLPDEVLAKLDEVARKIADLPKFQEQLDSLGFYVRYMPSAETRPYVLTEAEKYRELAQ